LFRLLPDLPTLFAEWEAPVGAYACHGRASFDARLVATMRTHGVTRLLTFNGADFARFPGLSVLDPAALAASATPPPSTTPMIGELPKFLPPILSISVGTLHAAGRVDAGADLGRVPITVTRIA
jgi:hypothetical protein